MRFIKIKITEGMFSKNFEFVEGINQVYSEQNATGKTTLLRLMLYSLGYKIPSTRKMNFDQCITETSIALENSQVVDIVRIDTELTVSSQAESKKYFLPYEHENFLATIFGTTNSDILQNLLAVFYIDQEKGWTLLNKGSAIGHIRFDLQQLVRGLTEKNCNDLIESIEALKIEIGKYQKMLSLAEYQKRIDTQKGNLISESIEDKRKDELSVLYFDRSQVQEELKQISIILQDQKAFKEYIDRMHLVIETPYGSFPVTKDNIRGLNDITEFAETQKKFKLLELSKINDAISKIEKRSKKDIRLDEVKTMIQEFDEEVANIPLNAIAIDRTLRKLQSQKSALQKRLGLLSRGNMDFNNALYDLVHGYLCDFGIEEYTTSSPNYIFTDDLKSLSGAILQLTVLAFKLAYISIIKKYINIKLPLIIDSPRGRELDAENMKKIVTVLKRDFGEHQIIIASIYKDIEDCPNYITLKDRLLGMNVES